MKSIITALLFSMSWTAITAHAEPVGVDGAEVTIPYQELRALLDAAEQGTKPNPEPKPPVAASLDAARFRLDFSTAEPTLTADFEVTTFTDEWHAVPLFGGDARLEKAATTDGISSVIRQDRTYVLLAKGAGRFAAKVSLALPASVDWEEEDGLILLPAPASAGELRIAGSPVGRTLRVDGLRPTRTPAGEVVFPLPDHEAGWTIVLEDTSMTASVEVLPSAWTLHSQILLRYADGRLRHAARIQCQANSGSGLSIRLALPPNATGITVEGEDIDDWKLEPRDADSRSLEITWETRNVLDRTFLLHWEIPQSPLSQTWELVPPRVRQPESAVDPVPLPESRALVALLPVEGLELTHPSLRKGIESLRLPEWLREQVGGEDGLSAEIAGDAPLSLAATWLPRLETAQATVSSATFETRLVTDGSTLVTAEYTVSHTAPITWTLGLPSVDEILACTLNGQDASPIRRGENDIEFRLAAPRSDGNESPSTTVRLSYSLKTDPLDPVSGEVSLELPLTSLFIHRLDWSLSIPEGYEPTAVEGNVRISTGSPDKPSDPHLLRLEKELCRGERPAVEVHYQNTDVSSES